MLGVNGTGQRKNFTVSDPISDSSTANILKPIKLGTTSSESDESFIDDIDVPLEDTKKLAKENNITAFRDVS